MTDSDDTELRLAARRSLQAKANAWRFAGIWAVLAVLFVVIWVATSPGEYFWPIWPIIGVGIGVAFTFLDAYGVARRYPSEDRIGREMERMRSRD